MPAGDRKPKTIAFVTYPGLTLLDLIGPITTFMALTRGLVSTSRHYRTVAVGERVEPIDTDTPMALIPDKAFEEVPDPFALIVPAGGIAALEAMGNQRLLDYLRFAAHRAAIVGSVSTSAFILAAAGLLDGRRATTHRKLFDARLFLGPVGLLTVAGILGSLSLVTFMGAVPLWLVAERGAAPDAPLIGWTLAAFSLSAGVSGIVSGALSARVDRRVLVSGSMLLSAAPLLAMFLFKAGSPALFAAAALAGALV